MFIVADLASLTINLFTSLIPVFFLLNNNDPIKKLSGSKWAFDPLYFLRFG